MEQHRGGMPEEEEKMLDISGLSGEVLVAINEDIEHVMREEGVGFEKATAILENRIGGQENLRSYVDALMAGPEVVEPTTFVNRLTGKEQTCRLESADFEDPIMEMSGCSGEFANDWRRQDIRDGCPRCAGEVLENASEPDVLARMGIR